MARAEDTLMARLDEIRQRFRSGSDGPAPGWVERPRRLGRFLWLSLKKAVADNLTHQASALAFITLVSLVPLLTAFSFIATRAVAGDEQQEVMVELLTQILPYSEDKIVEQLESFLDQARAVRGVGFAVFLITALTVFTTIEQTLNRVWNVTHRRPFRTRLWSFTLLIFWGPLLIGVTYSLRYWLEGQEGWERLMTSPPALAIPFVGTLLGLTMLYWLVPYTTVRFSSALGGGFVATVLLEVLRWGLALYLEVVPSLSAVYGSLGGVFLFFISVQLFWWSILLGSEVAYCTQHYDVLLHERRPAGAYEGSWLAVMALVVLARRFRRGEPITPHELLAERLQLPTADLAGVLRPLLEAGLVRETGGDSEGFLLACDPYELRLGRVFELYEEVHWKLLEPLGGAPAQRLEELRARLAAGREERIGEMTLIELLEAPDAYPEVRAKPAAASGSSGRSSKVRR